MSSSHDAVYQPPVGRGFSADDLAKAEEAKLETELRAAMPALLELGVETLVAQLKQEERMKALEVLVLKSLSPELGRRAREMFRSEADRRMKLERAVASQTKLP